jgi:hypothetical protein
MPAFSLPRQKNLSIFEFIHGSNRRRTLFHSTDAAFYKLIRVPLSNLNIPLAAIAEPIKLLQFLNKRKQSSFQAQKRQRGVIKPDTCISSV